MSQQSRILHPELFDRMPVFGGAIKNRVLQAAETTERTLGGRYGVSVVIRTLNEAPALAGLIKDLDEQVGTERPQLIVVDNESTDGTPELARSIGARVLTIPRNEFNYPLSMNLGVEAADNETVFMTVGHARLSNNMMLATATRYIEKGDRVGGVFARVLPGSNATRTERLISIGNIAYVPQGRATKKAILGVMAAQGAAISRDAWERLEGYDHRWGSGGEDTELAKRMLDADFTVIEDAAMAVHHTHGLGPINTARQWVDWVKMSNGKPRAFDRDALRKRRPDLDFRQ